MTSLVAEHWALQWASVVVRLLRSVEKKREPWSVIYSQKKKEHRQHCHRKDLKLNMRNTFWISALVSTGTLVWVPASGIRPWVVLGLDSGLNRSQMHLPSEGCEDLLQMIHLSHQTSNFTFFAPWFRICLSDHWTQGSQGMCGILVPQTEIEPRPSAVRAQSPNHWTTRGIPFWYDFKWKFFYCFLFLIFHY